MFVGFSCRVEKLGTCLHVVHVISLKWCFFLLTTWGEEVVAASVAAALVLGIPELCVGLGIVFGMFGKRWAVFESLRFGYCKVQ